MDIDNKTRLEALEKLRQGAWQDYDTRRAYEWKIAISIWTALTAFISLVLTGRAPSRLPVLPVVFLGFMVTYLHYKFIKGVIIALDIDCTKQFVFEEEITKILGIEFPKDLVEKSIR